LLQTLPIALLEDVKEASGGAAAAFLTIMRVYDLSGLNGEVYELKP
jgi:hypothetical protein